MKKLRALICRIVGHKTSIPENNHGQPVTCQRCEQVFDTICYCDKCQQMDPMQIACIQRAFSTGNMVIGNRDENGNVSITEHKIP
jgi:hypothetical protein